jgi:hypothetical protein
MRSKLLFLLQYKKSGVSIERVTKYTVGDTTKEQRALIRKNIERIKCRIIKFKPKKKNVR